MSIPHVSLHGAFPDRHEATRNLLRWFSYDHLPVGLPRTVSAHCCAAADFMVAVLPDGPELTGGLRHLLGSKDCFVRAAIAAGEERERVTPRLISDPPGPGEAPPATPRRLSDPPEPTYPTNADERLGDTPE